MNLYFKGLFTGIVLAYFQILISASSDPQIDAVERQIMEIWEKQDAQKESMDKQMKIITNLENDIGILVKNSKIELKNVNEKFEDLVNQLDQSCECYRMGRY
tara:strand:+ start:509 stop:814 length:306 start_codon:yes stop_codon:yes gene_type:complete